MVEIHTHTHTHTYSQVVEEHLYHTRMFKEEVYPGLDLVDVGLLVSMVAGPLLAYFYVSFALRQMGVNGILLTMAIPTFLLGVCGLLIGTEAPMLLKVFLPGLVSQVAELSQFVVAISSILAIPPVVNLVVDGVSKIVVRFSVLIFPARSRSPAQQTN